MRDEPDVELKCRTAC